MCWGHAIKSPKWMGLVIFDGKNYKSYTMRDLGFQSGYFTALCFDNKNRLWLGTNEGD